MASDFYYRRGWRGGPYALPIVVERSPYVAADVSDCQCKSGSQLEQKIKDNPLLFVIGALALGWMLAKKR